MSTKAACRRRRARRSRTRRTASRRCSAPPRYGDDVDRPLMKSDGSYTYFASDIAIPQEQVRPRLRQSDRRVRRRPRRLHQAHAGGGEGGHRRARPRWTSKIVQLVAAAARRRAGEDVEALGRFRHPARGGRRGRLGRRPLHDAVPQERRGARLRPRQGDRAVAATIRCSTSSTAMPAAIRSSANAREMVPDLPEEAAARAAYLGDAAAGAARPIPRNSTF